MNRRTFIVFLTILSVAMMSVPVTFASAGATHTHQAQANALNSSESTFFSGGGFKSSISLISQAYEGQHFSLFVNSTSGYSNYNATLYLGANYVRGMSPVNTTHKSSKSGFFEFNITAPEAANQTIHGTVIVTATFLGTPVNYTSSFNVKVFAPIKLYAEIYNSNYVPYYNVSLAFIINGVTLKTETISKLSPYSKKSLNITVISTAVDYGKVNTFQVKILHSASYQSGLSVSYTSKFFYGKPANYNWIYYIAGIVIVFMVFLGLSSGRGRGTKQPKWRTRREKPKKIAKK